MQGGASGSSAILTTSNVSALTWDARNVDAPLAVPEGGEAGVDHVGLGQRADVAVQGRPLRAQHAGQIRVWQALAYYALHQCAPIIVLDVAHPLRVHKLIIGREELMLTSHCLS